jgi:hypothetical protein
LEFSENMTQYWMIYELVLCCPEEAAGIKEDEGK